jgi:hypothetical protein
MEHFDLASKFVFSLYRVVYIQVLISSIILCAKFKIPVNIHS